MSGWIKLHRKITEHWIWQDPVKLKWWLTMLNEVNYKDGKFLLGNKLIEVKAGQSTKSIRTWAEVLNCSTRTANKFFELLELDGMITKKTVGKGKHSTTLINIENYSEYQGTEETLSNTLSTTLDKRKVTHKVLTIEESKERKEGKEINNNKYAQEIFSETQWCETVCMHHKISPQELKLKIAEFENHLILTQNVKYSLKEFKTHFTYWLKTNKNTTTTSKLTFASPVL